MHAEHSMSLTTGSPHLARYAIITTRLYQTRSLNNQSIQIFKAGIIPLIDCATGSDHIHERTPIASSTLGIVP